MSYVDREFAEKVFSVLPRFRRVPAGAELKLNARCPVCGDSQKDEHKARFWAYSFNDGVRFKCFNCDYSDWLSKYLKDFEEDLYREYLLEKRKERAFFETKPVQKEIGKPKPKAIINKLNFSDRLDTLPEDHPIIKYVKNRCIPKDKWNRLWFTMEWPKLCNSIKPETYKNEKSEPRLVIPIFNSDGKIESFQGRALRKDAPQKYITIKADDQATKIYGLDTVDSSKLVFVLEGPIDSLFVDNAIAITGGQLALDIVPFKGNRAWVMDAESRHPDTISRMAKLVDAGEKVVFWDKAPWSSKDINDMIKDEGATQEEINEYLKANVAEGLMAKMRLARYAKV